MEGLKIVVAAETGQAIDALQKLEQQAKKTGASSGSSLNTGSLKGAKALNSLSTSSNQASFALTNLGRVVQDATYGYIGIANNLNPLLESYHRLVVTTGSAGGALKSLGKSLIGPAGVGFALSAVSSLILVFGDRLFGSSKAAKAAEDANKSLADGIAGDIVKLTSLVAVITNVNSKQEDRVKALQAVNQEYLKYLPTLDKEKVTLDNIASAYDKIIDSLLRQAVVKGLQKEIEEAVSSTAKSIIALERAEVSRKAKQDAAANSNKKQIDLTNDVTKAIQRQNSVVNDGVGLGIRNQQIQDGEIKNLNTYEETLGRLKDRLKRDLAPLFGIIGNFSFDDLDIKLNPIKPDKVDDFLAPLLKLSKITVPVEASIDIKRIQYNLLNVDGKKYRSFADAVADANTGRIEKLVVKPVIYLSPKVIADQAYLAKIKALSDNVSDAINATFRDIKIEGLSSIGEAIGEALTGGNIGDVFKRFGEFLGSSLQALGKQIISIAITADVLKNSLKFLFDNPALAVAAGVALIAAGAALKNALGSGIKGFAAGGLVYGPTVGLVGEGSGTSRSNPEVIAPLDKLKGMLEGIGGGGMQRVYVTGRLRGNDMVLQNARTQRSQRRTTGI